MVGTVPEHLSDGLRELLIGVGTRNAAKVVQSFQTLDVLLPSADLKLLEQAESQLFDRFWGMSMNDLRKVDHREMRQFGMQFRELMYEMPFQLPHNLLLLGRTVAILSGMSTGLDPNFNLWNQLAPYAQKLIAEEGLSNWDVWLEEIGNLFKELIALPAQTGQVLARLERGELNVNVPQVNRQIYHLESAVNRLVRKHRLRSIFIRRRASLSERRLQPSYVFWVLSGATLFWMIFLLAAFPLA